MPVSIKIDGYNRVYLDESMIPPLLAYVGRYSQKQIARLEASDEKPDSIFAGS